MKKWIIVACCLALSACARNRTEVPYVPYVPNPNVSEPAKVIERVIRSQPPAWADPVPYEVIVKSDCIELRTTERGRGILFWKSPGEVRSAICYQNIGKIVLNKTDIWYVEITDRLGNWMCYVYSFDESEAKLFIDALYTMMEKQ
jgi:hypothetical protein